MRQESCEQCGHAFSPSAALGGMCPRCLLFGGADEPPAAELSLSEVRDAIPGFRVEALLGRGGMGTVFRARQLDLDRDVAIKFISAQDHDPSFGERFEREARTMARLNHPNIVTAHSYGRTADGDAFIVMEYVAGGDLAQLISAGKIPEAIALPLIEQLCSALAYAHDQGCVHRDIKPGNILIDSHGRVKVADFGLAKLLGENAAAASASALTLSSAGVGTPLYAAPEQTKPGAPVDRRADIYALGVVLYEMLTGELPLGVFQNPSRISGTLRRWDGLIIRAMDAQPERRFGTALDLGRELAVIHRELAFRTGVRRLRWKKPALIAACIVTAAFVLVPRLLPADFTIVRSGSEIVFTDKSGRGGPLTVSGAEPGQLRFSAVDRTFRIGWGARIGGQSSDISLAGVTRVVVHAKGATLTLTNVIALASGGSLEVEAGTVLVAEGANIVATGTGKITATASRNIVLAKGASVETEDGDLTLSANATGEALGDFSGIDIAGGTLTTHGTGKIALTGRGGAGSHVGNLYGIYLHRRAAVRSTGVQVGAGSIAVTGFGGGPDGSRNRGVGLNGEGTEIASVNGAVSIEGTAGGGEGDNLSGIDIRDGGKIISTGRGPNAASIQMRGTGGLGTGDYSCGIQVDTTDANFTFGAGIASVDGTISLSGTGGGGTATCVGVYVGCGATVAASGLGSIWLIGIGTDHCPRAGFGVLIFSKHRNGFPSQVTVADGDLTIDGIARHPASPAVKVEQPAFVRLTGKGRLTLLGASMELEGDVNAGTGKVTIAPGTAGGRIDLGGKDVLGVSPPTLGLTDGELSRITAGAVEWGNAQSGGITISEPISPENRAKLPSTLEEKQ